MKFGDISNEVLPTVGIRFEGVVQVGNELNRAAKAFIDDLFFKDVNVALITLHDRRKVLAFCQKWAVFYNFVLEAETPFEVSALCEEHQLLAYFDADAKMLETIGNRGLKRTEPKLWTVIETR